MEPQLLADYHCKTGEGPLWHSGQECIYWCDIPAGRLFRYTPATDTHEQVFETNVISGFTIQADGSLLLFEDEGRIEIWDEGITETVVDGVPAESNSRFNDVIADPEGRVICGTMPTDDRLGRLYRLDCDGTLIMLLDELDIPNGMGFTLDRERLYLTESEARSIYTFDYNGSAGEISEKELFVTTPDNEGVPDGLTVDRDGYVWSARWDGGCLVRYTPDGTEERRIEFPAQKVSSVAFGGTDYTDIYVTTAGGDNKIKEGKEAGALFLLDSNFRGSREFRSKVCLK